MSLQAPAHTYNYHGQPFALVAEPPKLAKPPKQKRAKLESKASQREAKRIQFMIPQATEDEVWFRHTNWNAKRKLVRAALASCGNPVNALDAFDNCGADCVVEYCNETGKHRLRASYCHNRHCEPCQRAKANVLAANLRKRLEEKPDGRYRFITLTLKHNTAPLRDQINRLYASFKRMRATKIWKDSQAGGCVILEVKWKPGTRHWHPHLHIIAEGGYLSQRELSAAWYKATGDSTIVDIRALDQAKDAAHYVAKYVSKGTNNEVWSDTDAAQEWIMAMKGVRSAATIGTWRGFKLLEHQPDSGTWIGVGLLRHIVADARRGEPRAVCLMRVLLDEKQYDPGRKHKKRDTPDT